jgi:hypothetical protein
VTVRTYASPEAFKQAVEQRLRAMSNAGTDFGRRRQLLVFDRFLARVVAVLGDAVMLKGGLVVELRLERARTTKDVDLRLTGSPEDVLRQLQEAARLDLGDFLVFEVGPDDEHPEINNEGMQYEGMRFRAVCRLAGKRYGNPFGVDVAFGDPILGLPEVIIADDILGFAGIAPPTLRIYPIETHVAEKLHAYTLPRKRPNSRVKDLPDIALLAGVKALDSKLLRGGVGADVSIPQNARPSGGVSSAAPVVGSALRSDGSRGSAPWRTLAEVTAAARAFLHPILADATHSTWDPGTWRWRPKR